MMIQLDFNTATHNERTKLLAHIKRYIGNGNKMIMREYILSIIYTICSHVYATVHHIISMLANMFSVNMLSAWTIKWNWICYIQISQKYSLQTLVV